MAYVLEPHTAGRGGIRKHGKKGGCDGRSDVHPELRKAPLTNDANSSKNAENCADPISFIATIDTEVEASGQRGEEEIGKVRY